MYHPSSENPAEEYLELLNSGLTNVTLTGWRITGGLQFTLTNGVLAPGGILVVAANMTHFNARYPGVTNVTGNWVGQLGNSRDTVQLEDATGGRVDGVSYADQGDWAIRQRGPLLTNHRGWVWFAPHDGLDLNTADGQLEGGCSLELINPALAVDSGQNWGASAVSNGTPGIANSIALTNVAPVLSSVTHYPPVPKPADPVTITVRVLDEQSNGLSVAVYYRNATSTNPPPAFSSLTMFDDGTHGDGLAGDRLFGAILPAQVNGSVVEFYVQAADAQAHTRTWPAAARQLDGSWAQTCNALYQVDDNLGPPTASNTQQPLYRLILTGAEQQEMTQGLMGPDYRSDAEMNGTFVSVDGTSTRIRYNCGVRIRGEGSRSRTPPSWRVNIPTDRVWDDLSAINLNTQFIHASLVGNTFALAAGLPASAGRVVQVRLNGVNHALSAAPSNGTSQGSGFGSYLFLEPINNEWAGRRFPDDGNGNVYRGSIYPYYANLAYEGPDVFNYSNSTNGGYSKTSNKSENDWSDLIDLTYTLSTNLPDSNYVAAVTNRLNLRQWVRYFAVCNLLEYRETSLCNGLGDDYAMYRGIRDPRFLLVGHDFDTVLGQGDYGSFSTNASIWLMLTPWHGESDNNTEQRATFLFRFLRHPEFAPVYFEELKRLCDGEFAPERFDLLLEQALGGWVPENIITSMKTFAHGRRASVVSQIPLNLTVNVPLPTSNGHPRSTSPTVTLNGQADAIRTRTVRVAGLAATWSAWDGRWTNTVSLFPGINNVLVQSFDATGMEVAQTNVTVWFDDGSVAAVGGAIDSDTTWTAAGGPYNVTSNVIVSNGVTLSIEPGATLYFSSGVTLTVATGGRMVVDGTAEAPIRFTVAPGSGTTWGGLTIEGVVGSPESRFAHTHFESNSTVCIDVNGGAVLLDQVTFGTRTTPYLHLDGASFLVRESVFPSAAPGALFELVHGTLGIRADGRGIFLRNFFGAANSITGNYNDVVDFTGGNRPGPIVHFIDNVFIGSGDDLVDLDGTDGWIEGNIFMHAHRNGAPDSSSAVSGGLDGTNTSELTLIGNLFYDCDHAAMAKEGNFYTLLNNTIVRQTHTGGVDTVGAVVCLIDDGFTEGAGMYLEGNVIYDAENLVRGQSASLVTITNNLIHKLAGAPWDGPGGSNSTNDPLLTYVPPLSTTTNFTTWASAQVMRQWFKPRTGSPAIGSGPNGRDRGGVIPTGASLSGEPAPVTASASATLTIGTARSGNGIPAAGFPNGSGYTHYKWRLEDGAWSGETTVASPIPLVALANGAHRVEVIGKRDSGLYQDTAELFPDNATTTSMVWTVDTGLASLRLNELLARNVGTLVTNGESPDLVELFNPGGATVDLSGMGLTDNPATPYKFTFAPGTLLGPGQFLVLFSDAGADPARNLGFRFKSEGSGAWLFDSWANGGALRDSVSFGPQLNDQSIGRQADGGWGLCRPTFGTANVPQPTTDGTTLKINEWLASGAPTAPDDFIELFNPDPVPAAMGGLYLTDEPVGLPARHPIAPLSFIAPAGWFAFKADANTNAGPEHLSFRLAPEQGRIGLFASDLALIDQVFYGPQTTGVSEGRTPSGADAIGRFSTPTPGAGNPGASPVYVTSITLSLMAYTNTWRYNQSNNLDSVNWIATDYNDSTWPSGRGLLAYETLASMLPLINTPLLAPTTPVPGLGSGHAYYFRTTLVLTNDLNGFKINARMRLDDCGVIYVNGVEVARPRMPAGPISNLTLGDGAIGAGTEADVDELFNIPASFFHTGTNVIAVEVHQTTTGSTDIVWGMAMDAVKAVTNIISVVLNEVLADNGTISNVDGTITDWVELYNPSATPLDLAGYSLSDNPAAPGRWVFPAGVVLAQGARLVVHCDPLRLASLTNGPVLNAGFGLDSAGETVCLFTPSGSLSDSVVFGPQATDFSLARVPDGGGGWALGLPTAGAGNIAAALGNPSAVRINEWAASVNGGPDWFELYNAAPQPVALGGLYLTDKLDRRTQHPIAPFTFLGVNTNGWRKFIADGDTVQGANHVGFTLAAGGEAIGLFPPGTDPAIDEVVFGLQTPDVSEGRFPDGGPTRIYFTRPSPGEANWLYLTNVVINEVLSHTDLPLEDAVELRNLSAVPVDIGGWFLSDDPANLRKFRIPDGTIIGANGFAVFYEYQLNPEPGFGSSFSFDSAEGDEAWLTAGDGSGTPTGYRDRVRFGPSFNGVAFGRYVTSAGVDFPALSALSFGTAVTAQSPPGQITLFRTGPGAANSYPRVGPVVITEIMYHPAPVGTNERPDEEFIELHNISGVTVPLYDPIHPTNGWKLRDAVEFRFTTNHSLLPGGYLLVVGFDPATNAVALSNFRARYGTNATLLGPWYGRLDNAGDSVELAAPDNPQTTSPDFGLVPYVLIDKVAYLSVAPWTTNADGWGYSLRRLSLPGYGNDPLNWTAGTPTAGNSGILDTDRDGLPDGWERANGLNRFVNDAGLDGDGDGFTNLEEYVAGTDPRNETSRLQIESVAPVVGGVQIQFIAVAGRTYSVLYRDALASGNWIPLAHIPAHPVDQTVNVEDTAPTTKLCRFYRVITPAAP